MASSMSRVCTPMNKRKMLRNLCRGGQISFSLLKRYNQSLNLYVTCFEYSKAIPQDDVEQMDSCQNDLDDFFGIEQLKDHTYTTESIDSHKAKQYETVDVARITQKAMDKLKPISNSKDVILPYGNVRFDRKIGKGFANVDIRVENEQANYDETLKRKRERKRKKIQRHDIKDQLNEKSVLQHEAANKNESFIFGEDMTSTKSKKYVNYAEDIGKIFDDQMQQVNKMPIGESKVLDEDPKDKSSLDNDMSYLDQIYFGKNDEGSNQSIHSQKEETNLGFIEGQYFDSIKRIADGSIGDCSDTLSNSIHDEVSTMSSNQYETAENFTKGQSGVNVNEPIQHTEEVNGSERETESKLYFEHQAQIQEFRSEQKSVNIDSKNKPYRLHKSEITIDKKEVRKLLSNASNTQMGLEANKVAIGNLDDFEEPSDLERLQSFENLKSYLELGNRKARYSKRKRRNDKEMSSAYNVSQQIRNEYATKEQMNLYGRANPKEYDGKGFRILSKQTPKFQNVPSMDIIKVLRQNILFDSKDVVAISKPYGIPLQGGVDENLSVDQYLSSIIPSTSLHSIDTMEADVTGVMLFGKTIEMKEKLIEKMEQGEICKKFLTITKNVPTPLQGEIDIPVVERIIAGKHRMALRPHRTPELAQVMTKRKPGRDAITRYRVLSQRDNSYALVECIPLTTVKHQLRVHLALGLNCPILGDHKYSHMNKMAPMNLHPIMLERLKIQQSKVRFLAFHLHCRSIIIPNFLDGRNLFVTAPFSVHLLANMRDLKLKLPPHV